MNDAIKQAELQNLPWDVENGNVYIFDGHAWVCTYLAE